MSGPVTYRHDETIGVITLDDGKANVLGPDMQQAINDAHRPGRPRRRRRAGDRRQRQGVQRRLRSQGVPVRRHRRIGRDARGGFELSYRLLSYPKPVVMACTGHAIAMGSFLLCSGDHRITAPAYNIQANEVAIGMVMPYAALEVVKLRLTRRPSSRPSGWPTSTSASRPRRPAGSTKWCRPTRCWRRAEEAAREFANLNQGAHAASKLRARAEALQGIRAGIDNMEAEFGI